MTHRARRKTPADPAGTVPGPRAAPPRRCPLRIGALTAALCAAVAAAPPPAQAEELRGDVTLYGWLPWIETETTSGRGGLSASVSGADVLDALDFTVMAAGNVQYGRVGAFVDVIYAKFSADATSPGPLGTRAKLGLSETLVTGALSYRVIEADGAFLDALAGARFVAISTDITVTGGGPAGIVRRASADTTWVDPVIGLRASAPVTDRLSVDAAADIGGFGVGSEFSWEVFGGVDYAFSDRLSGRMGFRYVSIDYREDGKRLDADFYGPAVGLRVRF